MQSRGDQGLYGGQGLWGGGVHGVVGSMGGGV